MKRRILRGLDDERELHRGRGHLDSRIGTFIFGAIHDVGPMNQLGHRSRVETVARLGDMSQKTCARSVVRIEELPSCAGRVALAGQKVFMILRRKECRLVVIEPPGDFGRRRIFEVDDRVFIAREFAFVEERSGAMHQPVIPVACVWRNALAMKSREQGGRASSVKTLVVIEDANSQNVDPPGGTTLKTGTVQHQGLGWLCQAELGLLDSDLIRPRSNFDLHPASATNLFCSSLYSSIRPVKMS